MQNSEKFWLHKSLDEMNQQEWESLCDGCGKCCLEKLEDEDSGQIYTTAISCRLLDCTTCKCSNYEERFKYMDDCIKLTPKKVKEISWLPKSCAYRLVKEKKDLPLWHPLLTNNKNSTIESKNSAKEFVIHPYLITKPFVEYILDDDDI